MIKLKQNYCSYCFCKDNINLYIEEGSSVLYLLCNSCQQFYLINRRTLNLVTDDKIEQVLIQHCKLLLESSLKKLHQNFEMEDSDIEKLIKAINNDIIIKDVIE